MRTPLNKETIVLPKVKHLWLRAAVLVLMLAAVSSCYSGKSGSYGNPIAPGGARELDSGNLGPGARFEHRFAAAGAYAYHCNFHSVMTGTVQVDANAADTLVMVNIVSDTTPFPAASVKPGGRVVWNNGTTMTHTVTSN